jgi:hypothetical protein
MRSNAHFSNITVNELAHERARCRPDKVRLAILGGALPAVDRGPGHAGRRPRFLIRESDAMAWIASGCPVSKSGA